MDIYRSLMIGFMVLVASSIITPILAGKRKLAGWSNFLFCLVASAIFLNTSYSVIFQGAEHGSALINFGAFKLHFLIDSFSAFFVALVSFMGALTAFYSIEYMEHYPNYSMRSYYMNYPLFLVGMIGIVTVDDLSSGFTIAWQLMTITSYFLIRFDYKEKGIVRSANKYLVLMEIAWALILGGMFLVRSVAWGDSIAHLTAKIAETNAGQAYGIYALILLGFAFKAGVFPFGQLWLPDAHSVAPSPISALLSGVMIKTGVYGIIRTLFWMVPAAGAFTFDGKTLGIIVAIFGAVTLFIGTVQALKQHDAKRLHAYHSIGQMGYIVLGIGSALLLFYSQNDFLRLLSVVAIIGALYHTLNHAIFKGLLFLATGSVQYATGLKDLNKLGGLIKLMPITAVIAGIASFSIAGIPAFSGFMSKWSIISADILAGSNYAYLVLFGVIALMTSAITLASYVKFFGMTFTSSGIEWSGAKQVKEVPGMMLLPKLILAALCIIQGLFPYFYFQTFILIFKNSRDSIIHALFNNVSLNNSIFSSGMGVTVSLPGSQVGIAAVAVPLVLVALFTVLFLLAYLLKKSGGSQERTANVWLCGYQELNNSNRYKSQGMYAAFKNFMKWTGGNVHD